MAAKTAAQEEFDTIISNASAPERSGHHPSDADDYKHDQETGERDEEEEHSQRQIDETLRIPVFDRGGGGGGGGALRLPHEDFDHGRTTGVKGVIADARSYEEARRSEGWRSRLPMGRGGDRGDNSRTSTSQFLRSDGGEGSGSEDEAFVERWRQSRRDELLKEGNDIRNRRTSPSVRRYGRFDEVDAMGYLDAIEKATRDTVVVVFIYDPESIVSQVVSDALEPLVPSRPAIHFVRVHYEDIEFDPAAVPAILAYKNQGDLFANLTYIIGHIPDDTIFDTAALETILRNHHVL